MRVVAALVMGMLLGCSSSTSTGSGGAGGTGGAGGAGASGGGGSAATPSCESYCASVTANCADDDAVYSSGVSCEQVCALLPVGASGDSAGNTVGCRSGVAEQAATDASLCPAAGPGGEGTCGSNCEAYCLLMQGFCGMLFDQDYMDLADCEGQCAGIPDVGGFSAVNTIQGDSIQCRLYHVSQAATDPGQHCLHAAGAEVCVP